MKQNTRKEHLLNANKDLYNQLWLMKAVQDNVAIYVHTTDTFFLLLQINSFDINTEIVYTFSLKADWKQQHISNLLE